MTALFATVFTSCSHNSTQNLEWIPFDWTTATFSGKVIEKATINIPVTIDELPYKFSMQFDLGAVTTVFYGNSLNPFLEKYPSLSNKLDMNKKFWIQSQENPMFRNVGLLLGSVVFSDIDVGLFTNFGTEIYLDSINSESEIHIGTIGSDLVQNSILIIDFKLNRLAIVNTLPTEYQNVSFEDFKIDNGRIKIPFQINEMVEYLMFDTGASIFSLVTSKLNALEIGGNEIVDSMMVPSWGELIPFCGLETVVPIVFGDKKMEKSIVYYVEDTSWDDLYSNFYKSEDIWGITGNAFFFNDIIIIDYKNNRFGVK